MKIVLMLIAVIVLLLFVCTEIVYDCSIYAKHKYISYTLCAPIMYAVYCILKRKNSKIARILTFIYTCSLCIFLCYDRNTVEKHIACTDIADIITDIDNVRVYYLLSRRQTMTTNVQDTLLEFDAYAKSQVDNRSISSHICIKYDFTKVKHDGSNFIEYYKMLQKLRFSQYGTNITFVLKVCCLGTNMLPANYKIFTHDDMDAMRQQIPCFLCEPSETVSSPVCQQPVISPPSIPAPPPMMPSLVPPPPPQPRPRTRERGPSGSSNNTGGDYISELKDVIQRRKVD